MLRVHMQQAGAGGHPKQPTLSARITRIAWTLTAHSNPHAPCTTCACMHQHTSCQVMEGSQGYPLQAFSLNPMDSNIPSFRYSLVFELQGAVFLVDKRRHPPVKCPTRYAARNQRLNHPSILPSLPALGPPVAAYISPYPHAKAAAWGSAASCVSCPWRKTANPMHMQCKPLPHSQETAGGAPHSSPSSLWLATAPSLGKERGKRAARPQPPHP